MFERDFDEPALCKFEACLHFMIDLLIVYYIQTDAQNTT